MLLNSLYILASLFASFYPGNSGLGRSGTPVTGQKFVIEWQNTLVSEFVITAWDRTPLNDEDQDQTFLLTGMQVRLSNGNTVNSTYVSTRAVANPPNGSNAKEYKFRTAEPIDPKTIEKIGLLGTGTIEGYKVAASDAGKDIPLYHLPAYSNRRPSLSINDREPAWLPSWAKAGSFIERQLSMSITMMTDVPAHAWITCEVELTDGDILLFSKKGPFTRNNTLKIVVPAPFTLKPEHISAFTIMNAKPVTAFRRLDVNTVYTFTEFRYNDDMMIDMKDLRLMYTEVGPGILKSEEVFTKTGLVRTYRERVMAGETIRKKIIAPGLQPPVILYQFITGMDDLRVHTKYKEFASEIRGELRLLGIADKVSGLDVTRNPVYTLTPDCCPWDQVGYLMQGEQGSSGNAWSGYYSVTEEPERMIPRKNIPFLRLYHVDPGVVGRANPFDKHTMASAVLPVTGCNIAYANQFVLNPLLGRGANIVEQKKHGAFGMQDDKWDCEGVIISYWTDMGWRRLLSSAFDLEPFMRNGTRPVHEKKIIDVYKYIEKGPQYTVAPVIKPEKDPVIYDPCSCRENGAVSKTSYTVTVNPYGRREVQCGFQFQVTCRDTIRFSQLPTPCAGECTSVIKGRLLMGNSLLRSIPDFRTAMQSVSFAKPGNYTLELTPQCGTKSCNTCRFYFTVKEDGCPR